MAKPGDEWWRPSNFRMRAGDDSTVVGRDNFEDSGARAGASIHQNQNFHFGAQSQLNDVDQYITRRVLPLEEKNRELTTLTQQLHQALVASSNEVDLTAAELEQYRVAYTDERERREGSVSRSGFLKGVAVALLAATALGVWLGFWFDADLPDNTTQANRTTPAGSPTSPTPETVVAGPTVTVTAEALPRVSVDTFENLPCSKGRWVSFISSINGSQADYLTQANLAAERSRAKYVNAPLVAQIHASRWEQTCADARSYATADSTRTFIWVGPMSSEAEAKRACASLKKISEWDCKPKSAQP